MRFTDYAVFTRTTAKYPGAQQATGPAMDYLWLGLVSEVGEIASKIKKVLRDEGGVFTPAHHQAIADEASDVLWYLTRLRDEEGDQPMLMSIGAVPGAGTSLLESFWSLHDAVAATDRANSRGWVSAFAALDELALALGTNLVGLSQRNTAKLSSRLERGVISGSGDYR